MRNPLISPGGSTAMSCPTCGSGLTLIIDFIRRQTYWQCQVCNPRLIDGGES
jgi:transposase-like protein